jgi:hypothetical protein
MNRDKRDLYSCYECILNPRRKGHEVIMLNENLEAAQCMCVLMAAYRVKICINSDLLASITSHNI